MTDFRLAVPPSRFLRTLSVVFALGAVALGSAPTYADLGPVVLAPPVTGLVVDGNASDWPEAIAATPVPVRSGDDPVGPNDYAVSFRVAHDPSTARLHVLAEVRDDVHVPAATGGDVGWESLDSVILYVDLQHRPGGSGTLLIATGDGYFDFGRPSDAFDPVHGIVTEDRVAHAVTRGDSLTTYEWSIELGGALVPGRSFGLDFLTCDRDESEDEFTYALWGEGWGKSRLSGQLSDVVLLGADERTGTLVGRLEWKRDDFVPPLPDRVRLTALDRPGRWVQAAVDSLGRYAVTLPVGRYRVGSAFSLSEPFAFEGDDAHRRIAASPGVEAEIRADVTTDAPLLKLGLLPRPDLDGERGALFRAGGLDAQALDRFLAAQLEDLAIPGASVAVVQGGALVYERALGVTNAATERPVRASTLFEAASISKPVFAFAAMRLAERGRIDLDERLHEILPFPNFEADARIRRLTARHVLSHQSGLENWMFGGPGGWRDGGPGELYFAPGEEFRYSGEAFNYLSRVLAHVEGKDIDDLLRDEVFTPFGMANSYFRAGAMTEAMVASGHRSDYPTYWDLPGEVSVASTLHTSAGDFARFLIGVIEGKGLEAGTYAEMFTPQREVPAERRVQFPEWEQAITLGFFRSVTPVGTLIEHGGNNGDFQCMFKVDVEAGHGFAVFANSNVGHKLEQRLFRYLFLGRS